MTASVFAAISVVGVAAPAEAAPAYPKANGRCVDQTAVLGQDLCAKVTAILLRDEKSTSDEIAVAVVPTTGASSIEAWSTGLFNTWGVGKKAKNNGVLLVVAVEDHKVRLETGRGVANRLGDSDAVNIVDDITSHFSDDEYALGILTGLDDVRRQLGHTVPTNALLAPLAATAPAPAEPDLTGSDDSGVSSDGSEFTTPDDFASADDGSVAVLPIAIGGFVVVVLLVVAIGRGSSRSAGRGLAHHDSTHQATWATGITDSATTSSLSGTDASGSAGPSFGGGSSDGGGATGSW
jgi:uncharacterized protein